MSITELGALGEFLGVFALVATLIYLTIQVRHSKEAMEESSRLARAAVFDTTFAHFCQFRRHIIDNADVARIWREGCAGRELGEDDRTRFDQLGQEFVFGLNSVFSQAVAAGNQQLSSGMPHTLAASVSNDPGMRTIWEQLRETLTTTGGSNFALAVDTALDGLTAQRQETSQ